MPGVPEAPAPDAVMLPTFIEPLAERTNAPALPVVAALVVIFCVIIDEEVRPTEPPGPLDGVVLIAA